MHQYHAFQLNIHSELAFPELLKQADVHAMTASDKVVIQSPTIFRRSFKRQTSFRTMRTHCPSGGLGERDAP